MMLEKCKCASYSSVPGMMAVKSAKGEFDALTTETGE